MPAAVSVVIAAYNVEAYIEKAIRSALDQQGVDVEVIVVDDCSSDNTLVIAQGLQDSRIRVLKLDANGGPSVARNAGFAAATAPWIAVLDGDDVFLPGRLSRMLECAKACKADIVVDNLLVVREADHARFPMFEPEDFVRRGKIDLAGFIAGNRQFLGGYTLGYLKPMFSTEFLRAHGLAYDSALRIGEDYMLFAEALASGASCAIAPGTGYAYTVRTGSISHRFSLGDVTRISEGDRKFLAKYRLDANAMKAQRSREKALTEAYAFTKLIEALKRRDARGAVKEAITCPTALRHLWRPVSARINRLVGR